MFELIPFDRHARSVAAFDPFRELDELERSFFGNGRNVSSFRTDVTDTGDAYKLEAELPGFKKEDIQIDVENEVLTISAQRSEELDQKNEESRYIRQERAVGSCARSFYVGKELEPTDIAAKFENGILSLHLPKAEAKKQEPKPTMIEIQ